METKEILEQFNVLVEEYPRDYTQAYELDPSVDELYDIYALLNDTLIDARLAIEWTHKVIGLLARSAYIDHSANPVVMAMLVESGYKESSTPTRKPWED